MRYTALVPNLSGLDRAHAAGVTEVAIFAAASETFSRKNINQTIDASLVTYAAVCDRAASLGIRVRAYVSTAFGCPFEGHVPPARVAAVAHALVEMGAFEVSVSDTIGIAHPGQVPEVVRAVAARVPLAKVALHFHDTRGTALANVLTALDLGVATFDASAGGLGGCPYAPGATGNLATEDLIYMLDGLGIESGVKLEALVAASAFIESRDRTSPALALLPRASAGVCAWGQAVNRESAGRAIHDSRPDPNGELARRPRERFGDAGLLEHARAAGFARALLVGAAAVPAQADDGT